MRHALSLLLLVLVAVVAPVEAHVSPEAGPMVPVETHVPSETAERGEHETVHASADALEASQSVSSSAPSAMWTPSTTRAAPPTRPPR